MGIESGTSGTSRWVSGDWFALHSANRQVQSLRHTLSMTPTHVPSCLVATPRPGTSHFDHAAFGSEKKQTNAHNFDSSVRTLLTEYCAA